MMRENIKEIIEEKGEKLGILNLRTILMYYLKGLPNTKNLKLEICKCENRDELLKLIENYKGE